MARKWNVNAHFPFFADSGKLKNECAKSTFYFSCGRQTANDMGLITTGDSVDDGVTVAQKTDNEAKESKTPSTRNSNRNPNYKHRPTQSKCDPTRDPFCIPFVS